MKKSTFLINPDSVSVSKKNIRVPRFSIKGHINSTTCNILKPFTGELTVENSEVAIKSIEIQLVRVETCGTIHFSLYFLFFSCILKYCTKLKNLLTFFISNYFWIFFLFLGCAEGYAKDGNLCNTQFWKV